MRQRLGADPSVAKLEQEYPGIIDAALAGARPIATDYVSSMIVKLKRHKAAATAKTLTLDEMKEVEAFDRSPSGARLSSNLLAPEQADHLVKRLEAKPDDDRTITEKDAKAAMGDALMSVMTKASSDDVLAIMRFESTPTGRKLRLIGEESQAYMMELISKPDPELAERQDKAMVDAMTAFAERAAKK